MDGTTAKIKTTFGGVVNLVSALSPILITFFMLMLTCMNQNFKGLIFIAGVLIAIVGNIGIMQLVGSPRSLDASIKCSLFDLPMPSSFNSPSNSSLFISFTFIYLFIPMLYNNQMNYPVIIILLMLFTVDSYSRVMHKCTNEIGIFLGWFVGILFGSAWFVILHSTGAGKLLYFNEIGSTSVRCDKPSSQTFKCSVFKNGVMVAGNIA